MWGEAGQCLVPGWRNAQEHTYIWAIGGQSMRVEVAFD